MISPKIPANEAERLEALRRYEVLDTAPEPGFDDLSRLAAHVLDVPIALVSLVDTDRQWFKSRYGLEAPQTPRDLSFCGHVVASERLLLVPDARDDERFHDNPLVTGDPRVVFYAGAPLRTPDGHVIGTLCGIDHEKRSVSARQLEMLEALARQVVGQLELRRQVVEARDFRLLFETTTSLAALAGFDGRLRRLGPAWTRSLGWSVEELTSRPFLDFVHPDDLESTAREVSRLVAGGEAVSFANRYRCKDGGHRWLAWDVASRPEYGLIYAVAHDVTELVTTREKLQESEQLLRETSRIARVGGWELDLGSSTLTWSEEVRRIHEVPPGYEPELETALSFYPPHAREAVRAAVATATETGRPWDLELPLTTAAGRSIWVRAVGEAATTDGRLRGTLQDITREKTAERLKDELVSVVSHELRTPLTSIRGSLRLLEEGVLGSPASETAELVAIAGSNTDRLLRLVNDLLDLDRIRSGGLELHRNVVEVDQLLHHAVRGVRGIADDAGVEIHVEIEAAPRALADEDRTVQVVTNLLANALQFSEPGDVVRLHAAETARERIRIAVSDRGPGIPAADQARVFDRFEQLEDRTGRRPVGSGLGLSISKAIVEQHGGTIGVHSEPGQGATFWFELDAAPAPVRA